MSEPSRRPAGWRQILEAPPGLKAEVVGGELWTQPRPLPGHGLAQAQLSGFLAPPFGSGRGGPGGWWILIEPDVALSTHDIVSPDLVGWRRERVPDFPAERPIAIVPDWVCEVLSPSTAQRDRRDKWQLYLDSGVPYYWLLDLPARLLEAYEASERRWSRIGAWTGDEVARVPPFAAVELAVGDLFPPSPDSPAGAGGAR